MTDRVSGFTVVLDHEIRIDDAEPLMEAIRQMRHVVAVEPVVSLADSHLAIMRRDREWRMRLLDLVNDNTEPKSGAAR